MPFENVTVMKAGAVVSVTPVMMNSHWADSHACSLSDFAMIVIVPPPPVVEVDVPVEVPVVVPVEVPVVVPVVVPVELS